MDGRRCGCRSRAWVILRGSKIPVAFGAFECKYTEIRCWTKKERNCLLILKNNKTTLIISDKVFVSGTLAISFLHTVFLAPFACVWIIYDTLIAPFTCVTFQQMIKIVDKRLV